MNKGQEVTLEELSEKIGRDLAFINNDYIYRYFMLSEGYSKLNINLKVIYNGRSSFSVYETERGNLLTIIQHSKRDNYYIVPIGVAQLLTKKILSQFDLIEANADFSGSVYCTMFKLYEMPDNERIDQFLYYLGIILFDTLGLDIYNSDIRFPSTKTMLIDALKSEFVFSDDNGYEEDVSYEEVIYIVSAAWNNPKISCCKVYESRKEDHFSISIHDLIIKACDELKATPK